MLGSALLITVLGAAGILLVDATIAAGNTRFGLELFVLIVVGTLLALLIVKLHAAPERWEHTFLPHTYDFSELSHISTVFGVRRLPASGWGQHERTVALSWLRTLVMDRLWLSRRWTGEEFRRIVEEPQRSPFLDDHPNLVWFLENTRDLSSTIPGTPMMQTREQFLDTIRNIVAEVEQI